MKKQTNKKAAAVITTEAMTTAETMTKNAIIGKDGGQATLDQGTYTAKDFFDILAAMNIQQTPEAEKPDIEDIESAREMVEARIKYDKITNPDDYPDALFTRTEVIAVQHYTEKSITNATLVETLHFLMKETMNPNVILPLCRVAGKLYSES